MTAKKKKDDVKEITEKMDDLNNALDLKLEDLEGIGTVRLKKLYGNGIYTVDDLTSRGEEELVKMLNITWSEAKELIRIAATSLRKDTVFSSMIVKGSTFMKYRKEKIKYMTTGLTELDDIMRGGYETGVMTELFGAYGSGKTQFMIVACIMAQMPMKRCCIECGKVYPLPLKPKKPKSLENLKEYEELLVEWKKTYDDIKSVTSCECGGNIWEGGGMSEFGKPCRVVYIDTENSFRPERLLEIVYNRELVKTKPQTKTEIKQCANKEPLDEEEEERAYSFIENIDYIRPLTSAMQMTVVENLSSIINGDLCKHCQKREVNEKLDPTHQNHPKVKKDATGLEEHDFEKDKPATLVIIDSIIAEFRKDFEGRGALSDRQTKLKTHIKHLVRTSESKNVVCLITNQIQEVMGLAGTHADNIRPVGGNEIAHTSTHRIYLKKPQAITKDKITAVLVDSPNNAKNEVVFELGMMGIQEIKEDS